MVGVPKPLDAHPADRAFAFVSRKLLAVLDANVEGERENIYKEVKDKTGPVVYRLLKVRHDSNISDTEFELWQAILALARWDAKGLAQTEAMLREKSVGVEILESRTGSSVSPELMQLFTGQAFRPPDETMKKEIRRHEGAREPAQDEEGHWGGFGGKKPRAGKGPWI